MNTKDTKYFDIFYEDGLEDFIEKSLKIFDAKLPIIEDVLGDIDLDKIKVSIYTNRTEFENYAKSISNGNVPPAWASGCFCGGEIQMIIPLQNADFVRRQTHTLTHEFVHLCINKNIYEKYKINRIRWFDESYASFIDGHLDNVSDNNLKPHYEKLKSFSKGFDMNTLNEIRNVKTQYYNGYVMFDLIGKYIFDNGLEKDFLKTLIQNPKQIKEMGETILNEAVNVEKNI